MLISRFLTRLGGSAVLASCLLVAPNTASAKTLNEMTGSDSLSWSVTYAESSIYNSSGGHAFWNLEANDGVNERWRFVNGAGRFDEGLQVDADGRHATLTGEIRKFNLNTNTFFGDTYSVDISFELLKDYDELRAIGGKPKKELHSSAYAINGGPVNVTTWRFYRMDNDADNRVTNISGGGDYYDLTHAPTSFFHEAQIGIGANNKNVNMGMSTWYISEHYDAAGNLLGSRQGDINVNLTPEPVLIVPVPAAAWMGLSLLGGLAAVRKFKVSRVEA